jgi:hypothetical protein
MKPTISGSNAFGVGPDQSPSDRYPPHVGEAKAQRPESDSSIGHLSTGDLAHGREVSGIGLKGPKSVLLPLNSGCLGKTDGSTTRCRNVVSRAGPPTRARSPIPQHSSSVIPILSGIVCIASRRKPAARSRCRINLPNCAWPLKSAKTSNNRRAAIRVSWPIRSPWPRPGSPLHLPLSTTTTTANFVSCEQLPGGGRHLMCRS